MTASPIFIEPLVIPVAPGNLFRRRRRWRHDGVGTGVGAGVGLMPWASNVTVPLGVESGHNDAKLTAFSWFLSLTWIQALALTGQSHDWRDGNRWIGSSVEGVGHGGLQVTGNQGGRAFRELPLMSGKMMPDVESMRKSTPSPRTGCRSPTAASPRGKPSRSVTWKTT